MTDFEHWEVHTLFRGEMHSPSIPCPWPEGETTVVYTSPFRAKDAAVIHLATIRDKCPSDLWTTRVTPVEPIHSSGFGGLAYKLDNALGGWMVADVSGLTWARRPGRAWHYGLFNTDHGWDIQVEQFDGL